jgi:uncharacterized protein YjaZ
MGLVYLIIENVRIRILIVCYTFQMEVKLFFIESHNEFSTAEKKKITNLTQKVFKDTAQLLKITNDVNITFYRWGKKNGGFTQAKDWIKVTIPKDLIDYRDLEAMLYHELHHTVRGYAGYMEVGRHYLLNSLFSEGLATAFELEKQQHGRKATHGTYTMKLVEEWLPQTKKELLSTTHYDYPGWFHGNGRPKQLGYKLGKYLYDEVKKHHPKLTHKNLVKKDARELLRLSKVKI